jgi:MFS family permease
MPAMPSSLSDRGTGVAPRSGHGRFPSRQLAVLFAYSLVNWSTGNGLLPLLPKYAKTFGATDAIIGIYLGTSYLSIALGTVVAGWLADRVGHRKLLMILVGLGIPPLLLGLSQAGEFWEAAVLTAAIWWLAGMSLALASIVAGMGAEAGERGRALGFLAVAAPTGSVIGGLGIGVLADALGFRTMWIALAALYLLGPAAGLLLRDVPISKTTAGPQAAWSRSWGAAYMLLLGVGLLAAFGSFIGALGRSLAMESFSNADITSTVAVAGIATLPFPFFVGSLSDRLGRLRFLALCYAAGVTGLVVYSASAVLWQFWLASALVAFVSYVSTGVGSALVVDLVPRGSVGGGLALFSGMGWAGGILGFVIGGSLFPAVGFATAFLFGATLLLGAALLLVPIRAAMRSGTRANAVTGSTEVAARKE